MSSEGNRVALIVACDRYADPDLKQLQAPTQDAERFARLLEDPKIGGFKVTRLINEPYYTIREKIDEFVQSCNREDTILLYFSCHGVKDKNGQLYFATITTNRKRLFSTGIESNFVNNMLDQCRAQQKVVLLDCCYSGAFEKGRFVRADKEVNATEFFGRGSVIITASDSMQYAFEGDDKIDLNKGSYFTNALVEGLETGKADVNDDGKITYSELYNYVHDQVRQVTPDQTPTLNTRGVEGDFVIFKNIREDLDSSDTQASAVKRRPKEDTSKVEIQEVRDPIIEFTSKARMLLEEKQYDNAIMIFNSILMLRSEHVEALNGKGMALYKQKKYKEASECFEKVLKIEPRHFVACDYLEMITDRMSKEHDGEAKPSSKDIRQDTAALEKRTEKKVIEALNESTQIPLELIKRGDQFYEKAMYQEAIICYDQALKIEPHSELAWDDKGNALRRLARYEEAIKCHDKAIEINPNHALAWSNKGSALINLGKYEEAKSCFDKVLEIDPKNTIALKNIEILEEKFSKTDTTAIQKQQLRDDKVVSNAIVSIDDKPTLPKEYNAATRLKEEEQKSGKEQGLTNEELLELLKAGKVREFNSMRAEHGISLDFSHAMLLGADLSGANLSSANLSKADLDRADLTTADLSGANLFNADLSGANLFNADLSGANLSGANLDSSIIIGVTDQVNDLKCADADFKDAIIDDENFVTQLINEGAKNVPIAPKNKEELRKKLEKRGELTTNVSDIDELVSHSLFV